MRYNYKDIHSIMENLYDLYNDGFPIYHSFKLIEDTALSKKYKNSIGIIKDYVKNGSSIGMAFNITKIYPQFLISLINVGEENGSLSEVLKNLSYYYYKKYTLNKYIKSQLVYPITILTVLILGIIAFLFIVFPSVFKSFSSINKSMSNKLLCLYNFVKFIKSISIIKIILMTIAIILVIAMIILLLIKCGVINNIFRKTKLGKLLIEYKFISFLRMIVASGSSIVEIIKMDIDYKSIGLKQKNINEFIQEIKNGNEISIVMRKFNFISLYTISIIKIGESRGQLEECLLKASKTLEKKLNNKISKVIKSIQPILIVIITILICLLIVEFVGPILDLMNVKGDNF